MFQIMVVEDDTHTRKLMDAVLRQNGYAPICASNGKDALHILDHQHIDLILLDIMMPNMDGFTFIETIRQSGSEIPVLIVTAKAAPTDKKKGFMLGTDDYMVKPVDEEEMILRINALLRRSKIISDHRLTVGTTILDYDERTVTANGDSVALPQKEFSLLFFLLFYPNKIFTRRQLMDEIWDMASDTDERTIDVHINRLRDRFRDHVDFDIVTVRGLGYKAVASSPSADHELLSAK